MGVVLICQSEAVQEEIERRRQRATRFQTEDSLAAYQPAVDPADVARRKKRAERFGTEFQPEDAAGLMDVGEPKQPDTRAVPDCWLAKCKAVVEHHACGGTTAAN